MQVRLSQEQVDHSNDISEHNPVSRQQALLYKETNNTGLIYLGNRTIPCQMFITRTAKS